MTKRSFFKSLSSLVATVALAPEIAFGRKLVLPHVFEPSDEKRIEHLWFWTDLEGNHGEWISTSEYCARWNSLAATDLTYIEIQELRRKAGDDR